MRTKRTTQTECEKKFQEQKAWRVRHYENRFSEWKTEASKGIPSALTDLPGERELRAMLEKLEEVDADVPPQERGRILYEVIWERHLNEIGPIESYDLAWISDLIDDILYPDHSEEQVAGNC